MLRRPSARPLALAGLLLALAAGRAPAAPDGPALDGKYALIVNAFGNDEFAIVELKGGAEPTARVVDTTQFLGGSSADVATAGEAVAVDFHGGRVSGLFLGTAEAGKADRVPGVFRIQTTTYPASLVKTDADKVRPMTAAEWNIERDRALRAANAKARTEKLEALAEKYKGQPLAYNFYDPLLRFADKSDTSAEKVKQYVDRWIKEAAPQGLAWAEEVHNKAIGALKGSDKYKAVVDDLKAAQEKLAAKSKATFAPLSLTLAERADKALGPDAKLEDRAKSAQRLLAAARDAGNEALAADVEKRSAGLETELDEKYHREVPPFKPEEFAGRKDKQADRVVVFEIFTGAQCPPCVGADVGFDAILETYEPTEVIGLQYHLHIPGPDPLTNPDTLARQQYYGAEVQGTPSTFFNGKRDGGSGGFMQHSKEKYDAYRAVIDKALAGKKQATIDLSAKRVGDEIRIRAKADAGGHAKQPKLRLVLVEKDVRYVGGNNLRFHHHVVRSFPGGVNGIELKDGKGEADQTVKLDDLRQKLQAYLDDFGAFPNPLPPIKLDDLIVVAMVQDDADHTILHAVSAPLDEARGQPQP